MKVYENWRFSLGLIPVAVVIVGIIFAINSWGAQSNLRAPQPQSSASSLKVNSSSSLFNAATSPQTLQQPSQSETTANPQTSASSTGPFPDYNSPPQPDGCRGTYYQPNAANPGGVACPMSE